MFTVYFPFRLSPERELKSLPFDSTIAGLPAQVIKTDPYRAVEVSGIDSEEQALVLVEQLSSGLHWAALHNRFGIRFDASVDAGYRPDDPIQTARNLQETTGLVRERIDLIADGARPHVRREGELAVRSTGQDVTFSLFYAPDGFVKALEEGLSIVRTHGSIPPRLRLACEVYAQTHFLSSGFARFQALFIPLEIAAPKGALEAQVALDQIAQWSKELGALIKDRPTDDPVRRELETLRSRLGGLKRQSHTGRLQEYVRATLTAVGDEQADKCAAQVQELYAKRGDLTHDGQSNVSHDLSLLEELVCRTLMAAFRNSSGLL